METPELADAVHVLLLTMHGIGCYSDRRRRMHALHAAVPSISVSVYVFFSECLSALAVRPSVRCRSEKGGKEFDTSSVCVCLLYIYKERDTHKQIECCTYDASTSNIYTKYVCNDESYDE